MGNTVVAKITSKIVEVTNNPETRAFIGKIVTKKNTNKGVVYSIASTGYFLSAAEYRMFAEAGAIACAPLFPEKTENKERQSNRTAAQTPIGRAERARRAAEKAHAVIAESTAATTGEAPVTVRKAEDIAEPVAAPASSRKTATATAQREETVPMNLGGNKAPVQVSDVTEISSTMSVSYLSAEDHHENIERTPRTAEPFTTYADMDSEEAQIAPDDDFGSESHRAMLETSEFLLNYPKPSFDLSAPRHLSLFDKKDDLKERASGFFDRLGRKGRDKLVNAMQEG